MNQLDKLKSFTTVVADTGDFKQIGNYKPQDATTNPSLILKSVQKEDYAYLLRETIKKYHQRPLEEIMDRLLVRFGCEILQWIPGRVSTEVDARLSFDGDQTVSRARRLIDYYRSEGVEPERVLIKVASTWEGIQAASILEKEGIRTNLTLLFSFTQAVACAQAGVQLISPFVGRIYDWHKKNAGKDWVEADHAGRLDPGVQSVSKIYDYYKHFGVKTEVMGASFRNIEQIRALSGCDLLTISPELLSQLAESQDDLSRALNPEGAHNKPIDKVELNESKFRFDLNEDAMATEKLAEGIRSFVADTNKLFDLLRAR